MPATLLSVLQSLNAGDQYLLQDGHKAARVKPTVGVKQGALCLLCCFRCTLMTLVQLLMECKEQLTGQRMCGSRTYCMQMT